MPAKSAKQYKFMQMMAHNPGKKRGIDAGPSKEVAEEFIHKTSAKDRSRFSKKKNDNH